MLRALRVNAIAAYSVHKSNLGAINSSKFNIFNIEFFCLSKNGTQNTIFHVFMKILLPVLQMHHVGSCTKSFQLL